MKLVSTLCGLVAGLFISSAAKAEPLELPKPILRPPVPDLFQGHTSQGDNFEGYKWWIIEEPIKQVVLDPLSLKVAQLSVLGLEEKPDPLSLKVARLSVLDLKADEPKHTLPTLDPNHFELERYREPSNLSLEFPIPESGSFVDVRVELPSGIKFDLLNESLHLGPLEYSIKDKVLMYKGNSNGDINVNDLFKVTGDVSDSVLLGGANLSTALKQGGEEFKKISQDGEKIVRQFWDEINNVLAPRKVETVVTIGGFFRDLLPQYIADGVVTPDEIIKIQKKTQERITDYYKSDLTEEEKRKIDGAVKNFVANFNTTVEKYNLTKTLRPLFAGGVDPFTLIRFKPTGPTLRILEDMLTDLAPFYHLDTKDNTFSIDSDLYARIYAQGSLFHALKFENYTFRTGFLSSTKGIAEGHLRVSGKVSGGRPLRDFFDPKYDPDLDFLELVLGYQPVFMDGSIEGQFVAKAFFESFYLQGYEEEFSVPFGKVTLGVAHGYKYTLNAFAKARFYGIANSAIYRAQGEFVGDFFLEEAIGQESKAYVQLKDRGKSGWYTLTLGETYGTFLIKDHIMEVSLLAESDLTTYVKVEPQISEAGSIYQASSIDVQAALRVGRQVSFFTPYLSLNSTNSGAGLFVVTPFFSAQGEAGLRGSIDVQGFFPLTGRFNEEEAQEHFVNLQLLANSFFPGSEAMRREENYRYLSTLDGFFLEAAYRRVQQTNTSHEPPHTIQLGAVAGWGGVIYTRSGYEGDFSARNNGLYVNMGNDTFNVYFSGRFEQIRERGTIATSIQAGGHFQIGNVLFTGWAEYHPKPLGEYFMNREKDGFSYNLQIDVPLDEIFFGSHSPKKDEKPFEPSLGDKVEIEPVFEGFNFIDPEFL